MYSMPESVGLISLINLAAVQNIWYQILKIIKLIFISASSTIVNNLSRPNVAPPMAGCLLIITIYTLTGAAVISEAQSWHYNDALYYCFVSLFTIGFGGARPQDPNLWICAIYLLFGVTLMSTCGHILHLEVNLNMQVYKHVKRRNQILLTELESAKADISWPADNAVGQQATLTQSVQKGVFSQNNHAHNGGHPLHGQARRDMPIQATP